MVMVTGYNSIPAAQSEMAECMSPPIWQRGRWHHLTHSHNQDIIGAVFATFDEATSRIQCDFAPRIVGFG